MRFFLFVSFATICSCVCDGDWSVQIPDSTTTIEDSYDVTISGSEGKYAIKLDSNSGTVTQGDRITNVVSNYQIPWDDTTLYAFIGADSTGIMMGWAYCKGNVLTDLWLEDTSGDAGFTNPQVTGSCSIQQTQKNVQLSTQDKCYQIDSPSNVPTINGQDLKLTAGSPGTVVLDGDSYDLLPFAIIDCKSCQSTNLNGGWIEVHAVMKSSSNVCLGIYYLQVIPKSTIALDYINCFFSRIAETEFEAQYQIAASPSTSMSAPASASPSPSASSTSMTSPTAIQSTNTELVPLSASGGAITSVSLGSATSTAVVTQAESGTGSTETVSSATASSSATNSPTGTSSGANHASAFNMAVLSILCLLISMI